MLRVAYTDGYTMRGRAIVPFWNNLDNGLGPEAPDSEIRSSNKNSSYVHNEVLTYYREQGNLNKSYAPP